MTCTMETSTYTVNILSVLSEIYSKEGNLPHRTTTLTVQCVLYRSEHWHVSDCPLMVEIWDSMDM